MPTKSTSHKAPGATGHHPPAERLSNRHSQQVWRVFPPDRDRHPVLIVASLLNIKARFIKHGVLFFPGVIECSKRNQTTSPKRASFHMKGTSERGPRIRAGLLSGDRIEIANLPQKRRSHTLHQQPGLPFHHLVDLPKNGDSPC